MSITAVKIGRSLLKIANSIVNFVMLMIILLVIVFGSYALWDSEQVHYAAAAARYEVFKPTPANGGKSFEELQAINPEVFGWLSVYGTRIDYPIVQGEDNEKYVNTNAEGNYALSGSLFLACENKKDFSEFNSIIFGHHMEKQTMFGELGLFSEKQYFDARRYGMLYYDGQEHGLEFFAFLHTDAYDSAVYVSGIQNMEMRQQYLNHLLEKASHTRDLKVRVTDHIVLLSTCSVASTNGRDILAARITGELYQDNFETAPINNTETAAVVDELSGVWRHIPIWLWLLIALRVIGCMVVGLVWLCDRVCSDRNEKKIKK